MQKQVKDENLSPQDDHAAALTQLYADVAHEVRNLVQSISGFIELEMESRQEYDSRRRLAKVLGDCDLVGNLLGSLLKVSEHTQGAGDINDAVQAVLDLYKFKTRGKISFSFQRTALSPVAISTAYLRLVLINIIKNAVEAVEVCRDAVVRVEARESGESVVMEIWNSGPPISSENPNVIFERFFTTKSDSGGTGIGLSVARRLLRECGGDLSVQNTAGGVSFTAVVRKAACPIPAPASEVLPESASRRLGGRRLLVVDDDNSVRNVLELMIVELGGGQAKVCSSGEEALAHVRIEQSFDAILLDMRMRGLSGQKVYEMLPVGLKKRVIFITGDIANPANSKFLDKAQQPKLLKPLNTRALFDAIELIATRNNSEN